MTSIDKISNSPIDCNNHVASHNNAGGIMYCCPRAPCDFSTSDHIQLRVHVDQSHQPPKLKSIHEWAYKCQKEEELKQRAEQREAHLAAESPIGPSAGGSSLEGERHRNETQSGLQSLESEVAAEECVQPDVLPCNRSPGDHEDFDQITPCCPRPETPQVESAVAHPEQCTRPPISLQPVASPLQQLRDQVAPSPGSVSSGAPGDIPQNEQSCFGFQPPEVGVTDGNRKQRVQSIFLRPITSLLARPNSPVACSFGTPTSDDLQRGTPQSNQTSDPQLSEVGTAVGQNEQFTQTNVSDHSTTRAPCWDDLVTCKICNTRYETIGELVSHLNKGHSKPMLPTKLSPPPQRTISRLRTGDYIKCGFCPKTFISPLRFDSHMKFTHSQGLNNGCNDRNSAHDSLRFTNTVSPQPHQDIGANCHLEQNRPFQGYPVVDLEQPHLLDETVVSQFECQPPREKPAVPPTAGQNEQFTQTNVSDHSTTRAPCRDDLVTCKICNTRYETIGELVSHLKKGHSKPMLPTKLSPAPQRTISRLRTGDYIKCGFCPKTFISPLQFDSHMKFTHSRQLNNWCSDQYKTAVGNQVPDRFVTSTSFNVEGLPICDLCNLKFVNSRQLEFHQNTAHDDLRFTNTVSPQPPQDTEANSNVEQNRPFQGYPVVDLEQPHLLDETVVSQLERQPPREKPAVGGTAVGQNEQSTQTNVSNHSTTRAPHWDGLVTCRICYARYETVDELVSHLNEGHSKLTLPTKPSPPPHRTVKPLHAGGFIKCGFCPKTFISRLRFDSHMKFTHSHCSDHYKTAVGNQVPDRFVTSTSFSLEGLPICDLCNLRFINSRELEFHQNTAHDDLRFTNTASPQPPRDTAANSNPEQSRPFQGNPVALLKQPHLMDEADVSQLEHQPPRGKLVVGHLEQRQSLHVTAVGHLEQRQLVHETAVSQLEHQQLQGKPDVCHLEQQKLLHEIAVSQQCYPPEQKTSKPQTGDFRTCGRCRKKFKTEKWLQCHLELVHSRPKCPVCKKALSTKFLVTHVFAKHYSHCFKCKKCSFATLDRMAHTIHELVLHRISGFPFICPICPEKLLFQSDKSMLYHTADHHPVIYKMLMEGY